MAFGDPHGAFGASGGFGGNYPGAGGSSLGSSPGGPDHGALGFGGMSPGGYNSSTYSANAGGLGGVPGFGKRVLDAQKARQLALQKQFPSFTGNSLNPQPKPGVKPGVKPGIIRPAVGTPPDQMIPDDVFTGDQFSDSIQPSWMGPHVSGGYYGNPNPNWGAKGSFGDPGYGSLPGGGPGYGGPRQFGGPVAPGQTYTVGENGPETLQMGPGGGGQVTPMNPADRLGGMPQNTMRDMFQLQMGQKAGPAPQVRPPNTVPRVAPTMPRPPQQPNMGFGGSGMGLQGVMGRLRSQIG